MSSNGHHRPSRGSLASESSNTSSQHSPRTLTHPLRTSQRSEAVNSPSGTFDTTSIKPPENGDQQVIGRRDTYSHLQEQYLETPFKFCLCQPDPKIPRPRNAFILYRQHYQAQIISQNPGLTNPEISKIIGEQWQRQTPEVKNEWKQRAEEEKARHQIQYPDYRYQPRRAKRRSSSAVDLTFASSSATRCTKCGGYTTTPTTPTPLDTSQTMFPPHSPTSANDDASTRYLPAMQNLSLVSPYGPRTVSVHGGNYALVPHPGGFVYQTTDPPNTAPLPMSPDGKRRRLNSGVPQPQTARPSISASGAIMSPHRDIFFPADNSVRQGQPVQGFMAPPPRSGLSFQQQHRNRSLTLPPLQLNLDRRQVRPPIVVKTHWDKVAHLARIAPPFKGKTAADGIRGGIIAVEGDDQSAVSGLSAWLGNHLGHMPEYCVRTAQGPKLPEDGSASTIQDYHILITDWLNKSKKIIEFITTKPPGESHDEAQVAPDQDVKMTTVERTPLVILERYQIYASDAFASRVRIDDVYSPYDHWQWMSTMWRDTVGPDVTIYIKDIPAEEVGSTDRLVNVKEDTHVITLIRKRLAGGVAKPDDKDLRRLAFEIGESVRGIARAKEDETPTVPEAKPETPAAS